MRVLVTGASGAIGTAFVSWTPPGGPLECIRADLEDTADGFPWPFVRLDVTDASACARAFQDVDAVVHLAADPDSLAWSRLGRACAASRVAAQHQPVPVGDDVEPR